MCRENLRHGANSSSIPCLEGAGYFKREKKELPQCTVLTRARRAQKTAGPSLCIRVIYLWSWLFETSGIQDDDRGSSWIQRIICAQAASLRGHGNEAFSQKVSKNLKKPQKISTNLNKSQQVSKMRAAEQKTGKISVF